jgi:hypothetical protein
MIKLARKPIFQDAERPITSQIDADEKAWEEIQKLATDTFNLDHNGKSGHKALSNKASGRNCPQCASKLRVKETTENGTTILICWNCHRTWHNTDLEAVYEVDENGNTVIDWVTDNMWRRIDNATINHWMDYFAKHKKKD